MKKLTLADQTTVKKALESLNLNQSELNFTNMFIWRHKYNFHIMTFDGTIVIVNKAASGTYFSEPLGEVDIQALVDKLMREFHLDKVIFKKSSERFKTLCLDLKCKVEEIRDDFDYLYDFEALRTLAGNQYHKKKNHVNKFIKTYEWTYEAIKPENMSLVRDFCKSWFDGKDEDLQAEYEAIRETIDNYNHLPCVGGLIKVNDQVVAFSIGEYVGDTFLIHFEKADTDYHGAYTMMSNQLLQHITPMKYVNREQDLGLPGLRKSKLSYHPIDFIRKYNVTFERTK